MGGLRGWVAPAASTACRPERCTAVRVCGGGCVAAVGVQGTLRASLSFEACSSVPCALVSAFATDLERPVGVLVAEVVEATKVSVWLADRGTGGGWARRWAHHVVCNGAPSAALLRPHGSAPGMAGNALAHQTCPPSAGAPHGLLDQELALCGVSSSWGQGGCSSCNLSCAASPPALSAVELLSWKPAAARLCSQFASCKLSPPALSPLLHPHLPTARRLFVRNSMKRQTAIKSNTKHPRWNETFEFPIHVAEHQELVSRSGGACHNRFSAPCCAIWPCNAG